MKIHVVSTDDINISRAAWDFSRPGTSTPLQSVLKIDTSVNEFASVVLKIESTIIEREIITSLRDHVMWAQTSRIEDPTRFSVQEELHNKYGHVFEEHRRDMEYDKKIGKRQDEYRLHTPILAQTKYMIRISLRSLVKLATHFTTLAVDRLPPFDQLFVDASQTLWEVLRGWVGSTNLRCLHSYGSTDLTPIMYKNETGRVGDTITVTVFAPFSLRTHMIRHRNLHVSDGMLEFIDHYGVNAIIGNEILIQASAMIDIWKNILKARSCWMSHYGMWGKLINEVQMFFNTPSLPCDKGSCPYSADAEMRYTDKDPNPPCPVHAILNNRIISEEQYDEMQRFIADDQRGKFWSQKLREAIS